MCRMGFVRLPLLSLTGACAIATDLLRRGGLPCTDLHADAISMIQFAGGNPSHLDALLSAGARQYSNVGLSLHRYGVSRTFLMNFMKHGHLEAGDLKGVLNLACQFLRSRCDIHTTWAYQPHGHQILRCVMPAVMLQTPVLRTTVVHSIDGFHIDYDRLHGELFLA